MIFGRTIKCSFKNPISPSAWLYILHDFKYQNCRNYVSIVHIRSGRLFVINSSISNKQQYQY